MKKKTFSACIMAALLTAGIASTQAAAGILAEGNISVYKGGNLSDTITGQNPVDEEALLVCNDKCMIKTTGISIVGATGTELAVKNDQKQFNLLLKGGQVDFILSGTIGKMGFYTTDRQYTSADVIYNASTASPVRGYMQVTPEGSTKIGVYKGQLVFDTVEGPKTIDSNNYILLAQADIARSENLNETGTAPDDGDWECNSDNIGRLCDKDNPDWECNENNLGKECDDDIAAGALWSNEAIISGTVVAGAAAWGVYEYLDDDDDDDNPAPGHVETTPPSQTPAGTSPNKKASVNATPPASPKASPKFPSLNM
ncbi:MAG: hypothetical protein QTN59_07405 [Candidatus Electrothrix communis]|nr:MAG: hypothetical protein QTN59_07405 [Candidatus Electrothrix communis]